MSVPQGEQPSEREGLLAACEVARRVVADRWPELAEVEPTVTHHKPVCPPRKVLQRAGVKPDEIVFTPERAVSEYTFTFASETSTHDGHSQPRIARVTVDTRQHVVKTTMSK